MCLAVFAVRLFAEDLAHRAEPLLLGGKVLLNQGDAGHCQCGP